MRQTSTLALGALIAILWRAKLAIILWATAGFLIGAGVGLVSAPRFKATVLLGAAPTPSAGRALSSLAGQFGGLAELAGVQLGGAQDLDQSLAILESEDFLEQFIEQENLLPSLFPKLWDTKRQAWAVGAPSAFRRWVRQIDGVTEAEAGKPIPPNSYDGYKLLVSRLDMHKDRATQIVTVTVEWGDPIIAAHVANRLPAVLNERARQRAIDESQQSLNYVNEQLEKTGVVELREALFRLAENEYKKAMVARVSNDIAIRVLSDAVAPHERSAPKRTLLALGGGILGGLFGCVVVLARRLRRQSDGGTLA